MAKLFDKSMLKFLLVGVGNTLLSMILTYVLYNAWGVNPVVSSAVAYVAGAVMSFFLNRYFTFQCDAGFWRTALKFALNAAVLWTITTPFLQPWLAGALGHWIPAQWANNLALLCCMGLYTVLNYFGQRFFAFRKHNE